MTNFAHEALWDGATRDLDAERSHEAFVRAKVSVASHWPFLAAAQSTEEFDHRLALKWDDLQATLDPALAGRVIESLAEDFALLREAAAQETTQHIASLRQVLANSGDPIPTPFAVIHQHKDRYQVDHVGSPSWLETIHKGSSADDAEQKGRQFADAGNMPLYKAGPSGYEKIQDAGGRHRASLRVGETFWNEYAQGWSRVTAVRADGGLEYQAYISPTDAERYSHYPDLNPPVDNGPLQGPDGFVTDPQPDNTGMSNQVIEQRQLTPGAWEVTPGTDWPVRPNAADLTQVPRTAAIDEFGDHDGPTARPFTHVVLHGNEKAGPQNGLRQYTHSQGEADQFADHVRQNGGTVWSAGKVDHTALGSLQQRQAARLTQAHLDELLNKLAGEGAVPTPGPNPNYFSQGSNGLAGEMTFPQDPAGTGPLTNNRLDDFYGDVPPVVSGGSQQGTIDGDGYSRANPGDTAPGGFAAAGSRHPFAQGASLESAQLDHKTHDDQSRLVESSFNAEASVGLLHNMKAGDDATVLGHAVHYDAQQALGDNGQPARGFTVGGFHVEHPEGGSHYFAHSPYNPKESWSASAKRYAAENAMDYIRRSSQKIGSLQAQGASEDDLAAIRERDPDGGETKPTQAARDAHRDWAVGRFGKETWDRYRSNSREGSLRTAAFNDGHVSDYVNWARGEGHDPDHVKTLKRYEGLPGIGKAHTNFLADQLYIGGGDQDWRKSAHTNGQIVGHCDNCKHPVRWHAGDDGDELRHLHNGSNKCSGGSKAKVSSLGQFFDPTLGSLDDPQDDTGSTDPMPGGAGFQDTDDTNVPMPSTTSSLQAQANQYIKQQGGKWVITQKGTGKVLSHHDSEEEAEASFRAMMQSKHGAMGLVQVSAASLNANGHAVPGSAVVKGHYVLHNGQWGQVSHIEDQENGDVHLTVGSGGHKVVKDGETVQTMHPNEMAHRFSSLQMQADGVALERPTAENPTGRGSDEFQATHWDNITKTRPMQHPDDRNVNTPVLPGEAPHTIDTNRPGGMRPDEESDEEGINQNGGSREASLLSEAQRLENQ